MASSPHRSGGEGDSKGDKRSRFFDTKTKNICWTKADTAPGRHPERWRKDAAGNIVCKRFFNCLGCLCYEYDHIIPYSKGMTMAKFDIEKFTGKNDFGLWRLKMRAILVLQGLQDALAGEGKLPSTLTEKEKKDLLENAHSALILSLGDRVLREVSKEKTAAEIWLKLENLYMSKSPENRLHLKLKLFTFKMQEGTKMEDHLDEFSKVIFDLENIDVTVDDEDQALLLLRSLPQEYKNLHETRVYRRDSLTLKKVQSTLMSLELKKQSESKIDNNGKGVMARGSSEKREFKHKEKSRSKSESRKCFVCKKEGHFEKNCPERKKFMKDKYNDEDSGGESTADNCQILQSRVNRLKSDKSQIDSDKLRGYSCDINFTDKELDIIEMAVYGDVIRPGNQCRCRTVDEMLGKFKAKDDTNACKLPQEDGSYL